MTPTPAHATRNPANPHAAFALHTLSPMRLAVVALSTVLALSTVAQAQTMSGTCTGTTSPVSVVAGLSALVTVALLRPGAVSVTRKSTDFGNVTPIGFPS